MPYTLSQKPASPFCVKFAFHLLFGTTVHYDIVSKTAESPLPGTISTWMQRSRLLSTHTSVLSIPLVLDPLYHFCKLPWDLVIRIPRFELSKEAACFLPPPSALSRVGTAILTKAMDTLPEPQQEVMQSQAVLPQLLLVPPFPFHQTILHTFQYSCDQRISECFTLISCF